MASGGATKLGVTGFSQPEGSGEQLTAGATYALTVTWTISPTEVLAVRVFRAGRWGVGPGMTTAEQLEQWRGRAVVDADGDDLGKLDDVYYGSDGEPVLARVRSGLMGRHQSVVPLAGSSVSRDYLRVAYRREQIEQAGRVEAGEYLDSATATSLGQAYGLVLPGSELGYETSANLAARQAEALAAQQRAAALDAQAQGLQGDAESARAKAERADASASQVEHDAATAARAADEARRQAEAAAADVPPTQ